MGVVTCYKCGIEFEKRDSDIKRTTMHVCSITCKTKYTCGDCGVEIKKDQKYCTSCRAARCVKNTQIQTPCGRWLSKHNHKGCHLVKLINKNVGDTFRPITNVQQAKYNAECSALYFIKAIFLEDKETILYLKKRISQTISNAKNRSEQLYKRHGIVDSDITVDYIYKLWISQNYRCALSGLPIIFANDEFNYWARVSLDRKDNSKGYVKGNIQLVSLPLNYAKNKQTDQTIKNTLNILKKFL